MRRGRNLRENKPSVSAARRRFCKNVNRWDKNTAKPLCTSGTRVLQKYDTFIIGHRFIIITRGYVPYGR